MWSVLQILKITLVEGANAYEVSFLRGKVNVKKCIGAEQLFKFFGYVQLSF